MPARIVACRYPAAGSKARSLNAVTTDGDLMSTAASVG